MKPATGCIGFIALALIAGVLISTTQGLTTPKIKANKAAREQAIVSELLGTTAVPGAIARLCRSSVRGYAGTIELLVLPNQPATSDKGFTQIAAVRVLAHRETPGIGDFITTDRSPWVLSFAGLKHQQTARETQRQWDTQLDAVSGATITRRAMIQGVANACAADE